MECEKGEKRLYVVEGGNDLVLLPRKHKGIVLGTVLDLFP